MSNIELRKELEKYKDITTELIDKIKEDKDLEELLESRQSTIKKIENLKFSKEEFQNIANSLNILEIEDKVQKLIKNEQSKVKNKIKAINVTREARVKYENNQIRPSFFNKKC